MGSAVRAAVCCALLASVAAGLQTKSRQATPGGPELIVQGRLQEALAFYRNAVEMSPKSAAAHNGAAVVLDLLGRYRRRRPLLRVPSKPRAIDSN